MYITNGCNIIVPRGDRADIPFIFTDKDTGDPYIFDSGSSVTLDIFPVRGEENAVTKTLPASEQLSDGTLVFCLLPAETDIPFGEYFYTITLKNPTGTDTLIGVPDDARFEIR